MSTLKSDQDFRRAARELGIDAGTLRDLLNTADPDELLQRAARVVADEYKELGAVARTFAVNEKHLGEAVWYLQENRSRQKQKELKEQREAQKRNLLSSFGSDEDIKRAAEKLRISEAKLRDLLAMADTEEFMLQAVWLAEGGRGIESVARTLGINEAVLRKALLRKWEADRWEARLREEKARNAPPSWLEDPPS